MSLATCIGREQNVFGEIQVTLTVLFDSPVLMYTDLKQLREFNPDNYYSVVELQYAPQEGLKKAIERVCNEVEMLVKNKRAAFVILSDRNIKQNRLVIPAAMAVGAVQRRLVEKSLRCDANVVVETARPAIHTISRC